MDFQGFPSPRSLGLGDVCVDLVRNETTVPVFGEEIMEVSLKEAHKLVFRPLGLKCPLGLKLFLATSEGACIGTEVVFGEGVLLSSKGTSMNRMGLLSHKVRFMDFSLKNVIGGLFWDSFSVIVELSALRMMGLGVVEALKNDFVEANHLFDGMPQRASLFDDVLVSLMSLLDLISQSDLGLEVPCLELSALRMMGLGLDTNMNHVNGIVFTNLMDITTVYARIVMGFFSSWIFSWRQGMWSNGLTFFKVLDMEGFELNVFAQFQRSLLDKCSLTLLLEGLERDVGVVLECAPHNIVKRGALHKCNVILRLIVCGVFYIVDVDFQFADNLLSTLDDSKRGISYVRGDGFVLNRSATPRFNLWNDKLRSKRSLIDVDALVATRVEDSSCDSFELLEEELFVIVDMINILQGNQILPMLGQSSLESFILLKESVENDNHMFAVSKQSYVKPIRKACCETLLMSIKFMLTGTPIAQVKRMEHVGAFKWLSSTTEWVVMDTHQRAGFFSELGLTLSSLDAVLDRDLDSCCNCSSPYCFMGSYDGECLRGGVFIGSVQARDGIPFGIIMIFVFNFMNYIRLFWRKIVAGGKLMKKLVLRLLGCDPGGPTAIRRSA